MFRRSDGIGGRGGDQAVIIEAIRAETAFGQGDMQQFWRSSADKTVSLVSSTAAKAAALQLRHVSRAVELWSLRHLSTRVLQIERRENKYIVSYEVFDYEIEKFFLWLTMTMAWWLCCHVGD